VSGCIDGLHCKKEVRQEVDFGLFFNINIVEEFPQSK